MSGASGEQVASVYASCVERIGALASGLSADELRRNVPGTPAWNVLELLSHLVGGPADVCAGNLAGVATEPWTQAQVEVRRGRSVAALLDEWASVREPILEVCRSGQAPALGMDIVTHEQDIAGALGMASAQDTASLDFAVSGFAGRAVKVAGAAGLAPIEFTDGNGWSMGEPGGVTFIGSKHDLIRVMAGRRSAAQVAAMDWLGDPTPYLALLSPFGPLGDVDVSE